jgi:hypothetical protein
MKEPKKIGTVLKGVLGNYKNYDLWLGTRGPKPKYTFNHMKKGQIIKYDCSPKKARCIQTAILAAAKREGKQIETENHGNFILIRRKR